MNNNNAINCDKDIDSINMDDHDNNNLTNTNGYYKNKND